MFMFSRNKKSPSKKAPVVEEKPLYAQLLPFANVMTEKVQVVNALAFTLISTGMRNVFCMLQILIVKFMMVSYKLSI